MQAKCFFVGQTTEKAIRMKLNSSILNSNCRKSYHKVIKQVRGIFVKESNESVADDDPKDGDRPDTIDAVNGAWGVVEFEETMCIRVYRKTPK